MFDGIINAVTDFIPKFIALVAAWIVATLLYQFLIIGSFDVQVLIHSIAVVVVAGLLTVLTVAALDSGK